MEASRSSLSRKPTPFRAQGRRRRYATSRRGYCTPHLSPPQEKLLLPFACATMADFSVQLAVSGGSAAFEWFCQHGSLCSFASATLSGSADQCSKSIFSNFTQYGEHVSLLPPDICNAVLLEDGTGLLSGGEERQQCTKGAFSSSTSSTYSREQKRRQSQ
jgi:hypothetical protein